MHLKNKPKTPVAIVAGTGVYSRSIGRENGLLRVIPDDLERFAEKTLGKPVIQGRKTFESIVNMRGKTLPNRPSIVVSKSAVYTYPDVTVVSSLEEAFGVAENYNADEIHIGGGPTLYDQAMPYVDRLYLTVFHDNLLGDTNFPDFEADFREIKRHGLRIHDSLSYEWIDYVRE